MASCRKYCAQPSFFDSDVYEACARWRHSRGGSFLTSFYGNGATKFDGLPDIPTILEIFDKFLRKAYITQQTVKYSDGLAPPLRPL
jgi:hypothetical protein